ncbi:hypothetical protein V6N13_069674 [Hibiscus sabdariffa]|uniref:Anther-specific protein BCP1 n=1 Tax=Hibiscus sabdariffa TaxID=183260 RepID=A0ABR2PGW9_9ROSI
MARQIVVLALVLVAFVGLVSGAAGAPASDSKHGSSPAAAPGDHDHASSAGAPAGASESGGIAGSSPPPLASAPAPGAGGSATLEASTIVGVGAAAVAGYIMF